MEVLIISCSNCKSQMGEQDTFCRECSFPERGTEKEKDLFYYRIKLKKDVVDEAGKKLSNVRGVLFFMAGVNLLYGLYYFLYVESVLDGIVSLIASAVFLGCAIWVKKQPLTGILAGFIFWILIQLLVALVDPVTIFQGILWKIIFLGVFIKGISSARDVNKYSKELQAFKAI